MAELLAHPGRSCRGRPPLEAAAHEARRHLDGTRCSDRHLQEHAVPAGERQRKPSLELLLPLAEAHQVPLDELVGAPDVGDPRIRLKPRVRNGRMVLPPHPRSSGLAGLEGVIPPERERELRRTRATVALRVSARCG